MSAPQPANPMPTSSSSTSPAPPSRAPRRSSILATMPSLATTASSLLPHSLHPAVWHGQRLGLAPKLNRGAKQAKSASSDGVPLYQKFAVGGVAGVIGTSVIFPIDLVKSKLQANTGNASIRSVVASVAREGGIGAFYKGLGVNVSFVALEKSVRLGTHHVLREHLTDGTRSSLAVDTLSGCGAGIMSAIVTNPMELLKLRKQLMAQDVAAGLCKPSTSMQMARELGPLGLYRGFMTTLIRDVPYNAIFFPIYATVRSKLQGDATSASGTVVPTLVAGAVAAMTGSLLCTPCDVIKTRIQARNSPYTRGFADAARRMFAAEGGSVFFRGAINRMAVQAPLYSITLLCFELQKMYLSEQHQ